MSDENNFENVPFASRKQQIRFLTRWARELNYYENLELRFYVFRAVSREDGVELQYDLDLGESSFTDLTKLAEEVSNIGWDPFLRLAAIPAGHVGEDELSNEVFNASTRWMRSALRKLDLEDRAVVPMDTPKGRAFVLLHDERPRTDRD